MLLYGSILLCLLGSAFGDGETNATATQRQDRVFSLFSVIRFPNTVCTGSTSNGTCYTAEECAGKSGTNDGSCAQGFGVCCKISLSCGGSSSENNTYLTKSSFTSTTTNPCIYKICQCSTSVCRVRLDFMTMDIAPPLSDPTGAVAKTVSTPATATDFAALTYGQCLVDAFTVGGVNSGSAQIPTICGINTGQHMYVDISSSQCLRLAYTIGSSSTYSRSWDMRVTQFACGEDDTGGPPDCLQWHTGTTGTLYTFNFPYSDYISASAIPATTQHLADQCYTICIRRESGYCGICYIPYGTTIGGSFGISGSAMDGDEESATDSYCSDDYITIPQALSTTDVATTTIATTSTGNRLCGRFLALAPSATASVSVCSRTTPFRLSVKFDSGERAINGQTMSMAAADEFSGLPGGIHGFLLKYTQITNCG